MNDSEDRNDVKENTESFHNDNINFLALTTGLVLAMTEDANAATVSMKTIPATSAKADSRVVNAFVELGFTVKYNKNLGYAGVFSVADHAIHLKTRNKTNTLHEMGHFVSRLQNGADETSEFVKIYKSEKKKSTTAHKKVIYNEEQQRILRTVFLQSIRRTQAS